MIICIPTESEFTSFSHYENYRFVDYGLLTCPADVCHNLPAGLLTLFPLHSLVKLHTLPKPPKTLLDIFNFRGLEGWKVISG